MGTTLEFIILSLILVQVAVFVWWTKKNARPSVDPLFHVVKDFQTQQNQMTLQQMESINRNLTDRMNHMTQTLEGKFQNLQDFNLKQLELIRATVDEKLQSTLEKRLGDSFKMVSERLEMVHKGLGEMQSLAHGVGDLKRVLSNVKTRGIWGEIQLRGILEQILNPSQFDMNVKVRPDVNSFVEFAIKMPGKEEGVPLWLPIDSKFPVESYEKILQAQELGDPDLLKSGRDELVKAIKTFAKDIRNLYIHPPWTTDFAILFVPTESLFAEINQQPGLVDFLQREYRVTVSGPTTLAALLNSLAMGFQTLAIQKRSSEVWQVLGTIKQEFMKFAELLVAAEKKLDEAKNKIFSVRSKTTTIGRQLRDVQTTDVPILPLQPEMLIDQEDV